MRSLKLCHIEMGLGTGYDYAIFYEDGTHFVSWEPNKKDKWAVTKDGEFIWCDMSKGRWFSEKECPESHIVKHIADQVKRWVAENEFYDAVDSQLES